MRTLRWMTSSGESSIEVLPLTSACPRSDSKATQSAPEPPLRRRSAAASVKRAGAEPAEGRAEARGEPFFVLFPYRPQKSTWHFRQCLMCLPKLVGAIGLEPTTPTMSTRGMRILADVAGLGLPMKTEFSSPRKSAEIRQGFPYFFRTFLLYRGRTLPYTFPYFSAPRHGKQDRLGFISPQAQASTRAPLASDGQRVLPRLSQDERLGSRQLDRSSHAGRLWKGDLQVPGRSG